MSLNPDPHAYWLELPLARHDVAMLARILGFARSRIEDLDAELDAARQTHALDMRNPHGLRLLSQTEAMLERALEVMPLLESLETWTAGVRAADPSRSPDMERGNVRHD